VLGNARLFLEDIEKSCTKIFVAHAYFALDLEILWDAIQQGIPRLKEQIENILASEKASQSF
jgi:uncharacterized protein with HEPN domain